MTVRTSERWTMNSHAAIAHCIRFLDKLKCLIFRFVITTSVQGFAIWMGFMLIAYYWIRFKSFANNLIKFNCSTFEIQK